MACPCQVPPASLGTAGLDTTSPSLAQTGLSMHPSSLEPKDGLCLQSAEQ